MIFALRDRRTAIQEDEQEEEEGCGRAGQDRAGHGVLQDLSGRTFLHPWGGGRAGDALGGWEGC